MTEETIIRYVADDGKAFDDEDAENMRVLCTPKMFHFSNSQKMV